MGGGVTGYTCHVDFKLDRRAMQTTHRYIISDPAILSGEPVIEGTRTPVRAIVELWRLGYRPEDIPVSLPHLRLSQVFDALSYYSDHQDQIHEYIQSNRVPQDRIDPLARG